MQLRINNIQPSFKALYRNPNGEILDVDLEKITSAESGAYIRRRVEETMQNQVGMPLDSKIAFVMNAKGDCMILPQSFGYIKYAGYIKTSNDYKGKPTAIITTEINRDQAKQYKDISGKLIKDGKVYASIGYGYNAQIFKHEKNAEELKQDKFCISL